MIEENLSRYRDQLRERKYFERRALMQNVSTLVETLDGSLSQRFQIPGSFLDTLADLHYKLEEKGVTRENSRRGYYRDVMEGLVSLSPLSPFSSNLGIQSGYLEFYHSFAPNQNKEFPGWINIDVGRNLVIRKATNGKGNKFDSVELTIPGRDYVYITDTITINHELTDTHGRSLRYVCTSFATPEGSFTQQVFQRASRNQSEQKIHEDVWPYNDDSLAAFQAHVTDFTKLIGHLGLQQAA